jgi:hypothetical protein
MSITDNTESNSTHVDNNSISNSVDYETIQKILFEMAENTSLLKEGYNLISNYERNRNFYISFLKIIFSSNLNEKIRKLGASCFKIFLNKNWSDDTYITNEERLVI